MSQLHTPRELNFNAENLVEEWRRWEKSFKIGLPYFEKQKSGHLMTNFHETKFMAPPTFLLSKAGR